MAVVVPGLEAADATAAPLPMRTAPLLLRFDRLLGLRSRARCSAVPLPAASASAACSYPRPGFRPGADRFKLKVVPKQSHGSQPRTTHRVRCLLMVRMRAACSERPAQHHPPAAVQM